MVERLNPGTILALYWAFARSPSAIHILQLAADTGCWTSTIYKAVRLGYLHRHDTATYFGTAKLYSEGRQAAALSRRKAA